MAYHKDAGRQTTLQAVANFEFPDLTDAVALEIMDLPYGAILLSGNLVVTTTFNSATSDTVAVTGSATLAATDVTSAARTALTGVGAGVPLSAPGTVSVTWDGTGTAPTQGAGYVQLEYIIDNRATEVQ
ncbi:MAG: hypothetical protein GY764_05300 [Halieaceae bacterium]|nr:hypothetical protein [Halieaceae bacterium]